MVGNKNKTYAHRIKLGLCPYCNRPKAYRKGVTCPACRVAKSLERVKARYGTFAALPRLQHVCSICGLRNEKSGHRLSIDHGHQSKAIRGYLCSRCNRGIGFFNDNPSLLQAAKEYIERVW